MQHIKCLTVGNGAVGKSSMLISYIHGHAPNQYTPTIFDNFSNTLEFEGRTIKLELWDSAGQEDYDLADPISFQNIDGKWLIELKHWCPKAKIILIGTKLDLRYDQETIRLLKMKKEKPITYSEGVTLAKKIGACKYLECSAYTKLGLPEIFYSVVQSIIHPSPTVRVREKRHACSIL